VVVGSRHGVLSVEAKRVQFLEDDLLGILIDVRRGGEDVPGGLSIRKAADAEEICLVRPDEVDGRVPTWNCM